MKTVFPWAVMALVVALALVGFAEGHTRFWPFSAIGYIDRRLAAAIVICCLVGMASGNMLQRKLAETTSPYAELVCVVVVSILFTGCLITADVQYPFLEGDGVLDSQTARLREHYARCLTSLMRLDGIQQPAYDSGRVQVSNPNTLQVAWKILGMFFLAISLWGVRKIADLPRERALLLALCLSLPGSATFLPYYDNYTLNYVLLALATFLFLDAVQSKSVASTVLACAVLGLSYLTHSLSVICCLYPILWVICSHFHGNSTTRSTRVAVVLVCLAGVMLATVWFATRVTAVNPHKEFCYYPLNVLRHDGWLAALGDPILLPLSFLVTYVLLCVTTMFQRKTLFPFLDDTRECVDAALFYGSQMIFWSYSLLQILIARANFGMLDFMSQCGALGGLFVVPTIRLAWQVPMRRHLVVVVLFNLFILLPTVLVHGSSAQARRVMEFMPLERGYYYADMSPYVHVGLRLARSGTEDLALECFRRGSQDQGFYRAQSGLNVVYYIAWAFEFRNDQECRKLLEDVIRTNPNMAIDLWRNGTRFTDRYHNKAYRRIRDASREILTRHVGNGREMGHYRQLLGMLNEFEQKNP